MIHESIDDFLMHYGVKGQKWGVKRSPEELGYVNRHHSKTDRLGSNLSNRMKNEIKYDWDSKRLKSPAQVKKDKSGNCHDQVMYELSELRKLGKNPKAKFFMEVDPKTGKGGTTHSFVYYKEGGKYKWLENAWQDKQGMHMYDSVDDIMKAIKDYHENGEFGNKKLYSKLLIGDFDDSKIKPGDTLDDIVNKIDLDYIKTSNKNVKIKDIQRR